MAIVSRIGFHKYHPFVLGTKVQLNKKHIHEKPYLSALFPIVGEKFGIISKFFETDYGPVVMVNWENQWHNCFLTDLKLASLFDDNDYEII